jgi:hypothetical protein
MATLYTDQAAPYAAQTSPERDTADAPRAYRTPGGMFFVWISWALAAAFWGVTLTTAIGIMQATGDGTGQGPTPGAVDAGGAGWGLMNFIGVAILGLALAYGAYRYATRDRRIDPVTEASTAALYDSIETGQDDGMVDRSPEARTPEERASYRPATGDLH